MAIELRRAYESPDPDDGHRVLVDRLWPRGVSRDALRIDEWTKDLAPSTELRKWFGHDQDRWDEFQDRYRAELDAHSDELDRLAEIAAAGPLTLVFAARDVDHNDAVVLRAVLEDRARRRA